MKTLLVPLRFDIEIPYEQYVQRITSQMDAELDAAMPGIKEEIKRQVGFWANDALQEQRVKSFVDDLIRKAVLSLVHKELSMEQIGKVVRSSLKTAVREQIKAREDEIRAIAKEPGE